MIARLWKGWTTPMKKLLRETALPGLQQIAGYRGGYILRQDGEKR
jgi:hypothetical protein